MLLKENPFYILDVSISADRKKIAEAADEIGFLLGEEISREAQSVLTNPTRRLNAEMAWFPGATVEDIASVRNAISTDQLINTSSLTGLSKLNAMIYNLGIAEYLGVYDLGFDIVAIDDQYNSINLADLTKTINLAREKAGMSSVAESEVQECYRKSIEDIRKLINDKLKPYDEKDYIDFVTVIGEQYVADKRHNAGPILFDIIDQYEIRMQSEIDAKADQIIQYVDLIKSEQDKDIIKKSIPKVIERVQAWDMYAQPLQCRSQATGLPHEISSKLAYEIRGLILFLNNEKQLTTEARDLASAMKAVFIELGEFKEVFTNDTKKLDEIEKENQDAGILKEIQTEFEKIDGSAKDLMWSELEPKQLKAFVALITSIDEKIRNSKLDKDTREKLRTALFYKARKTSVDVYNNKHNPLVTQYLMCVLTELFRDIDEADKKLQEDKRTINSSTTASVNMGNYRSFFDTYISPKAMAEKQRKQKITTRIVLVAAVLIFIVIAVINNNNSNRTRSGSYSGSSGSTYGSSSTKSTSKPTAKTTTKPTNNPEKAYSISSRLFDKVYVDIESIFPEQAIYTEKHVRYSEFVCRCTTTDGKTVWICFNSDDYVNRIDATANRVVGGGRNDKTVYYYPAARVHGSVISTSSLNVAGLESEIGSSMVIRYSSIDIPEQKKKLTVNNVYDYFDISLEGKEFRSGTGLTVTYSIKPKSSSLASSKKTSTDLIIRLKVSASKEKNGATIQSKDYTVVLKKANGFKASGEIFIPISTKMETVYWGHSVESCDGDIGN